MQPIHDFALMPESEEIRQRLKEARARQMAADDFEESLRDHFEKGELDRLFFNEDYMTLMWLDRTLTYRGTVVSEHLSGMGTELLAQFETNRGFVLVTRVENDLPEPFWPDWPCIVLSYLGRDFEVREQRMLDYGNPEDASTPVIEQLKVTGNHVLLLRRRTGSWFRIAVFDRPRRFLPYSVRESTVGGHVWHRRHFHITWIPHCSAWPRLCGK